MAGMRYVFVSEDSVGFSSLGGTVVNFSFAARGKVRRRRTKAQSREKPDRDSRSRCGKLRGLSTSIATDSMSAVFGRKYFKFRYFSCLAVPSMSKKVLAVGRSDGGQERGNWIARSTTGVRSEKTVVGNQTLVRDTLRKRGAVFENKFEGIFVMESDNTLNSKSSNRGAGLVMRRSSDATSEWRQLKSSVLMWCVCSCSTRLASLILGES